MSRSQVVGFAFLAAVALVVAAWLWISPPPPEAATTTEPDPTLLVPRAMNAPLTAEERAKLQAERLAKTAADAPSNSDPSTTKRATRSAQAQQLKQRLELVAAALDEAKKNPPKAGVLNKDDIQKGVSDVKPQIVGCYEQALAQNPKLGGTINVLFEIGDDPDDASNGAVVAGEVDSELGSPFFEACVLQAIVGARFPRPDGGIVKVTYPFTFKSVAETRDDD